MEFLCQHFLCLYGRAFPADGLRHSWSRAIQFGHEATATLSASSFNGSVGKRMPRFVAWLSNSNGEGPSGWVSIDADDASHAFDLLQPKLVGYDAAPCGRDAMSDLRMEFIISVEQARLVLTDGMSAFYEFPEAEDVLRPLDECGCKTLP